MDYLTQTIDELLKDQNATDNEVFDLVRYILMEQRLGCLQDFCSQHISANNAADVAFTNPSICDDYFKSNPMEPELIMKHMSPKQLAYHLTFIEPSQATELLEELLYYRNHGRI